MRMKRNRRKRKSRVLEARLRLSARKFIDDFVIVLMVAGGNPMGVGEATIRAAHVGHW